MKVSKNIINEHIGVFTVIKCVEKHEPEKESLYECVCDYCGNHIVLKRRYINTRQSCGCLIHDKFTYSGTFNELTVLSVFYKNHRALAKCRCSCGKICIVDAYRMKCGRVKSCGHLRGINNKLHGMATTKFYRTWSKIKCRCNNPLNSAYKYYGDRGITYCKEWEEFENFKEDMYESYLEHCKEHGERNTTLDRIDVNGNYEPSNCRWATYNIQANNKRNNHNIEYNGKIHSLTEWSRILNLPYNLLHNRIDRLHWDIDRAFTEPSRKFTKK